MTLFLLAISLNSFSNPISTVKNGKDILDFHQAFIQNPQALVMMHFDIVGLFINSGNEYKDFNNDLAMKMGVFRNLKFSGLEKVVFSNAPIGEAAYGAYTAEFSGISYKDCVALSNYRVLENIFISVEINGASIKDGGFCEKEWFFQNGKNKLKYTGS